MKFKSSKADKVEDKNLKRKVALLTLAVFLLIGFAVYAAASQSTNELPQSFVEARQNLSQTSKDIASLNTELSSQLRQIQVARKSNDATTTLELIGGAEQTNAAAEKKAENLIAGLGKMSQSLGGITPLKSKELATEAISTEMTLATNFIDYTKLMGNFLGLLSKSVTSDSPALEAEITASLNAVNQKVNAINTLNQEFMTKISDFDSSLQQ